MSSQPRVNSLINYWISSKLTTLLFLVLLPGCMESPILTFEVGTVETKLLLVQASPAHLVKRFNTDWKELDFTIQVSNKSKQTVRFYLFRLSVSGFNNSNLPIYVNSIAASYDSNIGFTVAPTGRESFEVYIPLIQVDFQVEPRLKLQISTLPIEEEVK